MKIFKLFSSIIISLILFSIARSQSSLKFEPYGLRNMKVTCLSEYGGRIYAGTLDSGVFRRNLYPPDSSWIYIGLRGIKILSIYPHQVGPIGFGITAGLKQDRAIGDTNLTYCTNYSETNWFPSDSGMNRNEIHSINAIDGFPTPVICGETFAGGAGKIYMKSGTVWEKVFDIGLGVINTLKVGVLHSFPATGIVWAGGENAIFAPFITKTTDKGKTWETIQPIPGDNACNSIAIHPRSDDTIYAGMEGSVIKSTDRGRTWKYTGLKGTSGYFYSLAIDPNIPEHVYAGGSPSGNIFSLFETNNGGVNWNRIQFESLVPYKGIASLLFDNSQNDVLLIATMGDGVFRLQHKIPIKVQESNTPFKFKLFQNYPNPFNPTTNIGFQIANSGFVTLKIFDILGREVSTLLNKELLPGEYSIAFAAKSLSGALTSGIYYYKIQEGNHFEIRKMMLTR